MEDTPTPEQLADALDRALLHVPSGPDFLDLNALKRRLRSGAVIVHPDDLPGPGYTQSMAAMSGLDPMTFDHYRDGYRAALADIFGEGS